MKTTASVLISLALALAGTWLLGHAWQERCVEKEAYDFSEQEARALQKFPEAMYDHGLRAWSFGPPDQAARFFRKALKRDPLFVDAWLKLAQAEVASGRRDKASEILVFTYTLTRSIIRWKWDQMLTAHELGATEVFYSMADDLIGQRKFLGDTFQLLDRHEGGNAQAVAGRLDAEHLPLYLKWLMRWGRAADCQRVWEKITGIGEPNRELLTAYVHFLVGRGEIELAQSIWEDRRKGGLMTNPGFEEEITRRGFDWRYSQREDGPWRIQRIAAPGGEEGYALEVHYGGEENISFHHLYQIVPVEPGGEYRLSYSCWSQGITTDQGPFVEVYGYRCKGLHRKGPMIRGTEKWHRESIQFQVPDRCRAVVVRLRRLPSHRFDNKISGTVWLDDFELEPTDLQLSGLDVQTETRSFLH